jgi:hypothetical protein
MRWPSTGPITKAFNDPPREQRELFPAWRSALARGSGKCGNDELVVFREKIETATSAVRPGFLISWNGFTRTVTKKLRGSRGASSLSR